MDKFFEPGMLIYLVPVFLIWGIHLGRRALRNRRSIAVRDRAIRDGMTEPASLHPIINHNRCIGCGSCVKACPEQPGHHVLGLINEKSNLINPTDCIGHGACLTACPADAITLVFGTETRGLDIPIVNPNFETDVPGIFIAGELGGMGLIRNAIEQGRQAIENIAKMDGTGKGKKFDVLIVGAGPAGFSATLSAMEQKLRVKTIEQDSLGGTVFQYPRGKVVMTSPVKLPLVGSVKFKETTKEDLLSFWQGVERDKKVKISYKERVETIKACKEGFEVKTTKETYKTGAVLLSIGRRGTPRKLGVPGEDMPKVVYRLIDPEQYRGKRVLVVGGGDSALEAATSIANEPDTKVTLSYRSEAFSRAKQKNRELIKKASGEGLVDLLMKSNVKSIAGESVEVEHGGKLLKLDNDAVIVSAGGILPTAFLKDIGITVETKYGAA
ncbi:MAG: NAD(P)-binding domain-containing protein [Proteobacteria bacterium]|nr:NAD(P)-binding domain-containing protein [Pseudomonadota bacterium]